MTSTYRPPFFLPPLTVPFLAPAVGGPPSRSSRLLAWLSELEGRGGGIKPAAAGPLRAPGGPLPTDAGVPVREGGLEGDPLPTDIGGPEEVGGRLPPMAERLPPLTLREGGPIDGGPEAATLVTRLGGPRGGGGVEAAGVAASAPPFLLTHLFKSLSK